MTEPVEELLRLMTEMTNSMPSLREIAGACEAAGLGLDEVIGRMEEAVDGGLVDVVEDHGPETLFILSTLGAEQLGVRLTFDSRRWMTLAGRLIGPHDPSGRYRYRPPRKVDEDLEIPLHYRVDVRQKTPDQILEIAEKFTGEKDSNPYISRLYGMRAIWSGEEPIEGRCPYCGGGTLGIHSYCLKCHNAGLDRFVTKPTQSRRKQMPGKSPLKGGV